MELTQEPTEKKQSILKKVWNFLKADTWQSTGAVLILIVPIVLFIVFPLLSLITNSSLPLVVVESCSMYHDSNLDSWWDRNAPWYETRGITEEEFKKFPMKNGLDKGDIILVWNRGDYEIGDIIIFNTDPKFNLPRPIIHRMVTENPISTKGDNGKTNRNQANFEEEILEENIIGKSQIRIPYLGWVKLSVIELREWLGTKSSGKEPTKKLGFCT